MLDFYTIVGNNVNNNKQIHFVKQNILNIFFILCCIVNSVIQTNETSTSILQFVAHSNPPGLGLSERQVSLNAREILTLEINGG